jgi:hypothetical protein
LVRTQDTEPLDINKPVSVFVAFYVGRGLVTGFTLGSVMVIVDLASIFSFIFCGVSFLAFHLTALKPCFF